MQLEGAGGGSSGHFSGSRPAGKSHGGRQAKTKDAEGTAGMVEHLTYIDGGLLCPLSKARAGAPRL